MLLLFVICLYIGRVVQASAETKVPVVGNHNKQLRLKVGERLRLECPVHSTSSGAVTSFRSSLESMQAEDSSTVLYHWQVGNRLDYLLDSDPRYRFNHNRRVLELTVPVEASDSGTYKCIGVTGFGKREVVFEVRVRDPDIDLLCATSSKTREDIKAPCFLNPMMKQKPAITIEQSVGNSVKLDCEADGTQPIRYRWFMGNTVADWITNSHGARGPVLTIDQIGREHTGHYTCQVSNLGGSLNYTYRLLVTEPPSATPKIIGQIENHTFSNDSPAILVAHIQCACEEPLIQWLKRIELSEEAKYEQADVTKILLPNAREAERNERFVVLGPWNGSPAIVDSTVSIKTDESLSKEASWTSKRSHQSPSDFHSQSYSSQQTENIYVTRLQLQKPLNRRKHSGKYVVMTMSLSDVKNMEYLVMFVDILEDPAVQKGRKILIYFLVPFCSFFAFVGLIAYLLVCRQRKSTGHSISSTSDRRVLRVSDLSPKEYQVMVKEKRSSTQPTSSMHSSSSHLTGKHPGLKVGVQSPLFHSEIRPNAITNGFEHVTPRNENGRSPAYCNTGSALQVQQESLSGSCFPIRPGAPYTEVMGQQNNCIGPYLPLTQCSNRNPQYPALPVAIVGEAACGTVQHNSFMNNNDAFIPNPPGSEVANSRFMQHQPTYPFPSSPSNLVINVPFSQSNIIDASFDQYSAVSQSPMSSSTLTNHYTAPFGDYACGFTPDGIEGLRQAQHTITHA